ncbi:MAG: threonine--tRNA ligase [Pseudobacteriovorax sp.]|nr:threonine--tRNA ligase [Pseudobacteriovorax sp.]
MNQHIKIKPDHRQIGQEQELFFFLDRSPGMPYWLPRGQRFFENLSGMMKDLLSAEGYQDVSGPVFNHQTLLQESGHWQKYQEDMFIVKDDKAQNFGLKAMNCPNAVQFYKFGKRSYKELPLRFSDQSLLFRNESSGALSGLFRLKQFRQDDAHIFVREDQMGDEIVKLFSLVNRIYEWFGLSFRMRLGGRPKKSIGSDEMWAKSEGILANSLRNSKIDYELAPEEGAFYGPKIDLLVKDSLAREWQLGSIQLDFLLPERFDLSYINEEGEKQRPVMIHRAIFGSFERFMAILLEHNHGKLPFSLAPEQVRLIPLGAVSSEFIDECSDALKHSGVESSIDKSSSSLNYKIREANRFKIPLVICLGPKEEESRLLQVRMQGDRSEVNLDDLRVFLARQKEGF